MTFKTEISDDDLAAISSGPTAVEYADFDKLDRLDRSTPKLSGEAARGGDHADE